jgi:hypothetical protein
MRVQLCRRRCAPRVSRLDHLVLTAISYDDRDDVVVIGSTRPALHPGTPSASSTTSQRILAATGDTTPEEMTIDVEDEEEERHETLVHIERPPALAGE